MHALGGGRAEANTHAPTRTHMEKKERTAHPHTCVERNDHTNAHVLGGGRAEKEAEHDYDEAAVAHVAPVGVELPLERRVLDLVHQVVRVLLLFVLVVVGWLGGGVMDGRVGRCNKVCMLWVGWGLWTVDCVEPTRNDQSTASDMYCWTIDDDDHIRQMCNIYSTCLGEVGDGRGDEHIAEGLLQLGGRLLQDGLHQRWGVWGVVWYVRSKSDGQGRRQP